MSTDDFLKRERELLGQSSIRVFFLARSSPPWTRADHRLDGLPFAGDDADLFASSTDPASSGAGTFDLPATDFPDLDGAYLSPWGGEQGGG